MTKIFLSCPYYPPHIGGLESHADEFNKHMAQEGIDSIVFTPRLPKDAPAEEIKYEKVRVIRFPAWEIIPNYPLPQFWNPVFWRQSLALFQERPDIVISRTRFFITSIFALKYAKIKKLPWIHIEHGSDFVQLNNPFLRLIARCYDYTFGRLVFRSASKVVANSKASARFVQTLTPYIRPDVIYRGVSVKAIEKAQPDKTMESKYPGHIITYVGRLIDGKGVSDLINAFHLLKDPSATLLIVGDGPQKASLQKLAKELQIGNKVLFLGRRPFTETIGLIKSSDIIVNPSYTEGLPTTLIEAALCRKAIIATNVGGTNEVIADNTSGLLVPPKQPQAIAENIQKLLKNPDLAAKLGDAAHKHAYDTFNWSISIKSYMELLNSYDLPR